MSSESRNARVVIALILVMSAGALCLRFLERGLHANGRGALLAATSAVPIASVEIRYESEARGYDDAAYDGLIFPDGTYRWATGKSEVRVAVVGRGAARMPEVQLARTEKLLTWLKSNGLTDRQISMPAPVTRSGEYSDLKALVGSIFGAN